MASAYFQQMMAIIAAAGAGLPEPLPIAGEYIQPWTYSDGTQLISLPGWATYDAAGVTAVAANRDRLQVKGNQLITISDDYDSYATGLLSYLRDVGSVSQCIRFTVASFISGAGATPAADSYVRVIFGASNRQNALVFQAIRSGSGNLASCGIRKLVAGVVSDLGSVQFATVADFGRDVTTGDVVEIDYNAGVVHVAINGVRVTPDGGISDGGYTPGQMAGFGSNSRRWRCDDLYMAPLTATSVTVTAGLSFWPSSDTGRLITLTGTTTGTPTALQTRTISAVDHSVIADWATNASTVFGAGTFSVSVFEPIGDLATRARYITQVRPIEDINGGSNSNAHAVGPAFLFYGQSNSANRDAYSGAVTGASNAYVVYNTNTPKNTSANPWVRGNVTPAGLHMFPKIMSERLGVPVGVICCGLGSQPSASLVPSGSITFSSDWSPNPLNPWGILLATCTKVGALGYVRQLTYTQGEAEADAFATPNVSAYQANISDIETAFRSGVALSNSAPFAVAIIGSYEGTPAGPQPNVNWPLMRQTLFDLPTLGTNRHVSSSLMHIPHQDAFHYTPAGYVEMNRRDAQTAAKLMGVSTYDGRGPIITSGTRSGAVITMAVDLNGAASIAGSAVTGFDVSADDFATLLTVSSVNVSGGNVVITLAADPSAAVKVRSYWGYRPTQTSVITGSYADGTTIQAEPIYNPITVP